MNQKELVKAVASDVNKKYDEAKKSHVSEGLVGDVIKSFTTVTTNALAKGDEVQLVGFGSFKVVHRAATTGRNPATGKTIDIPAKNVPKFKPGKAFKDAVNG